MFQKIISLIALTALALACSANASLEGKTAADAKAKLDPRDERIAKLEKRLEETTTMAQNLLQELQKNQAKGAPEQGAPKKGPAAQLLNVQQTPPPIIGARCGELLNPNVAYVDSSPLPETECHGKCAEMFNDTPNWMSIRRENGDKMLICANRRNPYKGVVSDTSQGPGFQEISAVPPGARVTWYNWVGDARFVVEYWSIDPDQTIKKVTTLEPFTFQAGFPALKFGTIAKFGISCRASGRCG